MNAVRLSVRDIQDVMAGPTLQNVMWTAIQLTRVWTTLWRLVQAVNKEQKAGIAMGVTNVVSGGATGAVTSGMTGGRHLGLGATLMAFVSANPWTFALTAVAVGSAVIMSGAVLQDINQRKFKNDWLRQQRETAKSQGFEY